MTLLDAITAPDALEVYFQPILELGAEGRDIFAFECLTRGPRDTNLHDAGVLFDYVRRKGAERVVDRICVRNALRHAYVVAPHDISINVHGSTLSTDPAFSRDVIGYAHALDVDPATVIVEIVEHSAVLNDRQLGRSLAALRDAGFRIALDDIGLGESNYKMIVETRPEFYKIDRYFVSGIVHDDGRAAVVQSIVELARRLGGRVIGEGVDAALVETMLRLFGVDLLQGYLYSEPLSPAAATTYAAASRFEQPMEVTV